MNETVKKHGVTFGLILGIFLVLRTVAIYAINLDLFTNGFIGFIDIIATIVIGIIAVAKIKKANGGFASFKVAFTGFFITMAIGLVIYSVFNILLFNVIDTDAKAVIQEKVVVKTVETFKQMNLPADAMKEMVKKMRENDSFGPSQQLLGLAITLVMYSIVGLIVAAIMKKEDPFAGIKQDSPESIGQE